MNQEQGAGLLAVRLFPYLVAPKAGAPVHASRFLSLIGNTW
jgi:hypothetical protein